MNLGDSVPVALPGAIAYDGLMNPISDSIEAALQPSDNQIGETADTPIGPKADNRAKGAWNDESESVEKGFRSWSRKFERGLP